ncbi:hypothetical protein [Rhizobium leguminosarum]|uniref:hypothetical protein n=1 Tax=Rhizobium leguminosarum TaxID=384 RepID=UPI002E143C2F|nr:hypothetical protein U8Q02_43865 [Rhizobium leguminosarum]
MFSEEVDPRAVLEALDGLEAVYPGFRSWWETKVVPGVDDGTRRIVADIRDGRIVAAGVFKRSSEERKICTLWAPGGAGVSEICRRGMRWLGTDRPSFSISQEMLPRYRRLLAEIDAGRFLPVKGVYRPDAVEFIFDGGK